MFLFSSVTSYVRPSPLLSSIRSYWPSSIVLPVGVSFFNSKNADAHHTLTQQHPADLSGVEAFPDHGDDRTGSHVLDHPVEERLGGQVGVVELHVVDGRLHELHRYQLQTSTSLETLEGKNR